MRRLGAALAAVVLAMAGAVLLLPRGARRDDLAGGASCDPEAAAAEAPAAAGEKNAARELAKLEKKLTDKFVTTESVVVTGSPGPAILEQARESGADYIVLGSHGHTAIYELLVGSTAHIVLLKAACPVVIVPAGKSKPTGKTKAKTAAA